MCVTNTVYRRAAVTLPAASLSNSPSMVSQRLFSTVPTVESYAKPVVPTSVFSSSAMTMSSSARVISSSSDSEQSFVTQKRRRRRRRKPQQPGKTAKMNDRHFVVHDYHDHASDDVSVPVEEIRRRGGVATAFPLKLHSLLDKIEEDGLAHVVSWQPHGRCFVVHDPKLFTEVVMPKYFRQTRLTSFQRQLNLYGFNRITKGRDNGGYYHELFLRGRVALCKRMTRTKVKGTKFKAASSPDSEPDFYKMPFVTPLQGSGAAASVVSSECESVVELAPAFSYNEPQERDLMLDFAEMWDPENTVPAPPRIAESLDDIMEPFSMPDGLIENDAQLGELLEALLEE